MVKPPDLPLVHKLVSGASILSTSSSVVCDRTVLVRDWDPGWADTMISYYIT